MVPDKSSYSFDVWRLLNAARTDDSAGENAVTGGTGIGGGGKDKSIFIPNWLGGGSGGGGGGDGGDDWRYECPPPGWSRVDGAGAQ